MQYCQEAATSKQEVENGATCTMGAERSAARGYGEHPGEAHSCPPAAHPSVPVAIRRRVRLSDYFHIACATRGGLATRVAAAGEAGCLTVTVRQTVSVAPSPLPPRAVRAPLPEWRGTVRARAGGLGGLGRSPAHWPQLVPQHGASHLHAWQRTRTSGARTGTGMSHVFAGPGHRYPGKTQITHTLRFPQSSPSSADGCTVRRHILRL